MSEYLVSLTTRGAPPALQAGDVITGGENGHGWGSRERKSAWIAAGNPAKTWPGAVAIIRVPLHNWLKTMIYAGGATVIADLDERGADTPPRFNFRLQEITPSEAAALAADGEIELSDDRADDLLVDRLYGLTVAAVLRLSAG